MRPIDYLALLDRPTVAGKVTSIVGVVALDPDTLSRVVIRDAEGNEAGVDSITNTLQVIGIVHHKAHEGELFSVSYKAPDGVPLADNATIVLAIRPSTKYLHFQAFCALGGDAELEFYSGSTVTADGTLMMPNNHNIALQATHLSDAVVRLDPTVTVVGALRDNFLVPGGTGGNSIGGDGNQRDEWIIPPAIWAFVRLTNRAGNAQPASLKCVWYEEGNN